MCDIHRGAKGALVLLRSRRITAEIKILEQWGDAPQRASH